MDSFLEDFLKDTISMLFMRISVLMKNTTLVDIFKLLMILTDIAEPRVGTR